MESAAFIEIREVDHLYIVIGILIVAERLALARIDNVTRIIYYVKVNC